MTTSDRAAAFHLAALRDDDGRVRSAARRVLEQHCVGYHTLGDDRARHVEAAGEEMKPAVQ